MKNDGTLVLPCADGSDRNCYGPRTFDTGVVNLTSDQIDDIQSMEGQLNLSVSAQQLKDSGLDTSDPDVLRDPDGTLFVALDLDTTCVACSD